MGPGPNLPQRRYTHCQASYGHTTLIIGGSIGGSATATVLKFESNNINNAPIQVESMLNERSGLACTIFNSALHENRPIAIAAGSWDGAGSWNGEIWDFTEEGTSWQQIGNLP